MVKRGTKKRSKLKNKQSSVKSDYFNENERGSFVSVFLFILLLSLFIIISILVYQIYLSIPGEPQELEFIVKEQQEQNINGVSEVKQFYPNMKFNHNTISYKIDVVCDAKKRGRVISAFDELSYNVNIIKFYESQENPDIEVICDKEKETNVNDDHFIAGEGGANEIIQTGKFNVINKGLILLYDNSDLRTLECSYPNVELHELMHVFGFDHSSNKESLMYPYLDSCNQKLDNSIIEKLNSLYSQPNLPDLYFEDVKAIKKGIYLDFNLTIKNSGDIGAKNLNFSVFDEGELVESRKIGNGTLDYGAGFIIEIANFKLLHRNPKEISFVLDYENVIAELDESNNIAKVEFE